VSETIKCTCSHCAAKYRLPLEAQGRRAKCKRCGETFEVPKAHTSLEDSILDWLTESENEEETTVQPRVISMPAADSSDSDAGRPARGVIRMKNNAPDKAASHG
jgi:hypothetical protein